MTDTPVSNTMDVTEGGVALPALPNGAVYDHFALIAIGATRVEDREGGTMVWPETLDTSGYAAFEATRAHAALVSASISAASSVCDTITAQVIPDATHQQAYDKAAMIVSSNAGAAPSSDPFKTAFGNLGAAVGIADPDTFAKVVTAVTLASIELGTILATLKGAADAAKTSADLASALRTFEAAIETFVSGLNAAGLTAPVTAPAPIIIVGVNG